MISVKSICVRYNGRTILDNVSADFEDTRIHLICLLYTSDAADE